MLRLIFDIETDGLLPELTKVHCLVIKNADTGEVISCHDHGEAPTLSEGLELLRQADLLIGHNLLTFDLPALQKVYPEFDTKAEIMDTLVLSRLIWSDLKALDHPWRKKRCPDFPGQLIGSHKLEAWGWRLGNHKGDFGKNTDWSVWTPEMQTYCEQDVEVTAAFWRLIESKNYAPEAIQLEHDFQKIIHQQEQFGVPFNTKAAVELYGQLAQRRQEIVDELQAIFPPRIITMKTPEFYSVVHTPTGESLQAPTKAKANDLRKERKWRPKECEYIAGPLKTKESPFNPGSDKQTAERLTEKYGWQPEVFTDGGDPSITEEVLEGLLDVYPEAKALKEHRAIDKVITMIAEGKQSWLKHERDGRIHGRVITNGTAYGRCSHTSPNLGQVPAVETKGDTILTGYEGGWGFECRSLFGDQGEDWLLVGADASGLELRCLAHFLARYDGGAYMRELLEGDIHTANQNAAGLETRAQAKTFIYAFLYGAGDQKIGSIVAPTASPEKQKKIGRSLKARFLAAIPALGRLEFDVKWSCGFTKIKKGTKTFWTRREPSEAEPVIRRYLTGLDGRQLPVRSSHAALNALLQSAGGLVMKKATVIFHAKLRAKGWKPGIDYMPVLHVHDEYQTLARKEIADEVGRIAVASIQEAGEYFGFRCPLDGEYKIGRTWAETH
jgi:DNA polymerase I-like protein with 3'-5' exonuclease and polymerase domains